MVTLLLACAPDADTDAPDAIDWSAPPLEPELSVDGLEDAAHDAFTHRFMHPLAVYDWYLRIRDDLNAAPDVECPKPPSPSETDPRARVSNWRGSCTGEEYAVEGGWITTYYDVMDGDLAGTEVNLLFSLHGSHVADAAPIYLGGILIGRWSNAGGASRYTFEVRGTYHDGDEPGALSEGVSVGMTWDGTYSPLDGVRGTFDGSIGGPDGGIDLQEVTVDGTCGDGATGIVAIRDPSMGWWTVTLPDDCSGCGPASFAGTDMGTSCVGLAVATELNASIAASEAP